jgi:hypothetical protein
LPQNIKNNPEPNVVFVLLDYCSQDDLADYIYSTHAKELFSGKLVFYRYMAQHEFRMAHAKNMAHRLGILEGADILVNLDADNYTGPGFAKYIAETLGNDSDAFMWSRMIPGVLVTGMV